MDLYNHEDIFEEPENEAPTFLISLPAGETLVINGPRQTPMVITITNKSERNPKRDAKMLAACLATSIDEQTMYYLTELLIAEYMAPMVQETKRLLEAQAAQERVKPPRKPSKNDNQS